MDKLKQKREERAEKLEQYEALVTLAGSQELTEEQKKQEERLAEEIEAYDKDIAQLERMEKTKADIAKRKAEARAVGAPQDNASENREVAKFSFARAMQTIHKKKSPDAVDGIEREMFDEAQKEASERGFEISGNIAIPSRYIKIGRESSKAHRRDLTVATEGTDVVETTLGGVIPILNPDPIAVRMGVQVLSGLNGDVQFPRHTGDVSFAWEGESDSTAESTPTFDNVSLSPTRVAGFVDVTDKMLKQSSFVVEPWLRRIIENRYALTVDTAIINGSGSNDQPFGILNYSGVGVVELGTNGGSITYAAVLDMLRQVKSANARMGMAGWTMNADVMFELANVPKQTSGVEGNFILDPELTTFIGRPYIVSEQMPGNLTKGGSGSSLSSMIYSSNWGSGLLGTWGGLDILYDPYTQALTAVKRFVMNAFLDFDIEQPAEFCVIKDIVTQASIT